MIHEIPRESVLRRRLRRWPKRWPRKRRRRRRSKIKGRVTAKMMSNTNWIVPKVRDCKVSWMTRTGEEMRDGLVVSTAMRARRGVRDTDPVSVSTETR